MNSDPTPKVSVLIPVFNAERYLGDCLQSVAQQSLRSLEIICVDDGSEDRSLQIIRDFQQIDGRVRTVTHAKNRGEGAARNTGLDIARGRYVFHLDADDLLPEHALETLWRVADTHGSQMVKGAYRLIAADGQMLTDCLQTLPEPAFNVCLANSGFLRQIPVSHCSYLYELDFLTTHGLRYPTDLRVGLDLVALTRCLVAASRVSVVPDVVYSYRQTDTSVTRGVAPPELMRDGMEAKHQVSDLLGKAGFEDAAHRVLRTWTWQITAFWASLDPTTSQERVSGLFDRFRSLIPSGFVPWEENSPLQHRYILALVVQGRDDAARRALAELRDGGKFLEARDLGQRLATILEVAPADEAAAKLIGGAVQ